MKILLLKRHVFKQEFEIAASREYLQLENPKLCSNTYRKFLILYLVILKKKEYQASWIRIKTKVIDLSIYTKQENQKHKSQEKNITNYIKSLKKDRNNN